MICYHAWYSYVTVYNSGPNTDAKSLLKWRALSDMRVLQCLSCRLWRLFTPLCMNDASSVHNTWHRKSDSSTVLCRNHWQNWRQRLQTLYTCTCKGTTAPHAVYAKLHAEKSPWYVTWWVIIMYSIQQLFILHTAPTMAVYWWQECFCFPQTLRCTTANMSVGLCLIWIQKLVFLLRSFSICIAKAIHEMTQ